MSVRASDRRRSPWFGVDKPDLARLAGVCAVRQLAYARSVYFAVLETANDQRSQDEARATHGELAQRAGVSVSTLKKCVAVLIEAGLLDVQSGRLQGEPNVWILLSEDEGGVGVPRLPGSRAAATGVGVPRLGGRRTTATPMETSQENGKENNNHHHHQQPPSEREVWLGVPEAMRADGIEFLKQKRKVGGRIVTEREMAIAAAALAEFNRQLEGRFELGPWLSLIVARVRDHPSWDAAAHVRLVQSAFRLKWWERRGERRRAKPPVIWSEAAFPNVVDDASREAEARREIEMDRRLRDKVFDGRPWDELTRAEQENAKESMAMGGRPWEANPDADAPPAPRHRNGNGHALNAANILDDE